DQQALKNLIAMTPYAYKASPERRMQLEQKAHLQVTASFQIYLFQKRNKKAI
ncbi:methyltransferase, partial [Escherichia coli]|nr:methyltransferase [Escherichia coli]